MKRSSSETVPGWTGRVLLWWFVLGAPLIASDAAAQAAQGAQGRAGFEIAGQVADSDGRPLAGARVMVVGTGQATATDRSGNFRVRVLEPGEYRLRVELVGFGLREATVMVAEAAGPAALRLVLDISPLEVPAVVVTANPTGGSTLYQPVQAFRSTDLQRLAAPSVGSVLDGQPGLAARSFGSAPARPVIRGLDGDRLLVLENGERMGDTQERAPDDAVTLDPLAVERIEVVRGPASLLYGSNALGGVINLITRDVPALWATGMSGDLAVDGASVNSMIGVSGRLVRGGDRWSASARGVMRQASDAATPSHVLPNSSSSVVSGATGLGYRSVRFHGGFSVGYHGYEYGVPEFAVQVDPSDSTRFIEHQPENQIQISRVHGQLQGEWSLNGWVRGIELRSSGTLSQQQEGEDEDGEEEEDVEQEIHTRTLGTTLIVRHSPFAMFDAGALGLHVRYNHQEIEGTEAYHPGQRQVALAGFVFQEVPLRSRLRLQLGGRVEGERLRTLPNQHFAAGSTEDASHLNLSGSVGLNFRPRAGVELGAQLARAHRNPNVVELYASGWDVGAGRVEIGDPTLPSEIAYGLDLFGVLSGERARIELTGFVNSIDNFIAVRNLPLACGDLEYRVRPDREFPPCVQYFAADARLVGGEASVEAVLPGSLRSRVATDYVRGTRRDVGDPLPFIPPSRSTFELHRETPVWSAGAIVRWTAAQNRVPEDELPTEGYALLNLRGSYRLQSSGQHMLVLRVDNIFDRSYSDHLSVVRRFPEPVSPENPVRFEMPGRNVQVSYRYSF